MPSAISPTESMSPTKAPFVFPAEQPELIVSPSDALSPQLPSLGDFMGSSRSSFMDEKNDSDLMKVPSNGSSVYSNLNEYRKSRVVTVGANESALDDIVKFTNVQAERMLSPQGSIQDFQAQRTGSSGSLYRPGPVQRTSNNSEKSIYSAYSPGGTNIAQRTPPSDPPQSPLPALPLGKKASIQFSAEHRGSFAQPSASYTSPLASPRPYSQQGQTQRKVSPPTNFSSNNPFGASGGFSPVDETQYSLGAQTQSQTQSYQQSGNFGQQEQNRTFPPPHPDNDLPSSLRPFSPPIEHTMGTNGSTMKAPPTKLTKEPQSLQHAETTGQTGPPSAPLEPKKGERKVSPTAALGNFANLRNKLTTRPSEDVRTHKLEEKEKDVDRSKMGGRFGKLKSRMRSSNEDENSSTTSAKVAAVKEEGSGWSRLKSKVKRNGDDGVEKDKDGRPMLAPISTTNPTDTANAPKLGSPFQPSVSPGFEPPAAPQYQAYSPASAGPDAQQQRPRGDTSASTIRPYTPGEGAGAALSKTDSELALTPTALELSQVHPVYRDETLAGSSETLTKLDSLRAPAPQFHPDASLRQRAGSAPTRGGPGGIASGPNSGTNSPMISRNNSAYNSGANSPSTQNSGYPFPVLPPGQERRPQTGLVKGPKNDYPMLMPKELSSEMSQILAKSPFLNTPATKRKVLPSSASDKPATDGAASASGGSSGSHTLVAEDDTIYPAPKIALMQLECFQAHRQMRTSRNDVYAVACGICNAEDRGKRWCCAWCSLRCCQDCIRKLRSSSDGLVGVLNGLGNSDVVENLYAEKIEKAKEAEKLMSNLAGLPTFSFDVEKGIAETPQLDSVPGAFPVTPQLV